MACASRSVWLIADLVELIVEWSSDVSELFVQRCISRTFRRSVTVVLASLNGRQSDTISHRLLDLCSRRFRCTFDEALTAYILAFRDDVERIDLMHDLPCLPVYRALVCAPRFTTFNFRNEPAAPLLAPESLSEKTKNARDVRQALDIALSRE
jgi:hypothetical protein